MTGPTGTKQQTPATVPQEPKHAPVHRAVPAPAVPAPSKIGTGAPPLEVTGELGSIIPPAPAIQLPPERFASNETWNNERIHALAMYCSDGRWGGAFDEFCQRSLLIPRYDRFAVPGGPAWLVSGSDKVAAKPEENSLAASLSRSAWEQLGLLVRVHELQRIVLVGHYGCAFYMEKLKKDADGVLPLQLEHLKRARLAVRERFPRLTVETYLAMRRNGRMSFHGTV
jgi:hypothetical protein